MSWVRVTTLQRAAALLAGLMGQGLWGLFFGGRGPERCQELALFSAGEILVRQLDQTQTTQFNTLNQPLSCKGVEDDGCAEHGWSHAGACSILVFGVLPRSLCEGGHRGWWAPGSRCSLDVEVLFLEVQ